MNPLPPAFLAGKCYGQAQASGETQRPNRDGALLTCHNGTAVNRQTIPEVFLWKTVDTCGELSEKAPKPRQISVIKFPPAIARVHELLLSFILAAFKAVPRRRLYGLSFFPMENIFRVQE